MAKDEKNIRVRALERGRYDGRWRKPGAVFDLTDNDHFSGDAHVTRKDGQGKERKVCVFKGWMEEVDPKTPLCEGEDYQPSEQSFGKKREFRTAAEVFKAEDDAKKRTGKATNGKGEAAPAPAAGEAADAAAGTPVGGDQGVADAPGDASGKKKRKAIKEK